MLDILVLLSDSKHVYIKPLQQQQQALSGDCAKHETQCRRFFHFIVDLCNPLANKIYTYIDIFIFRYIRGNMEKA